MERKKFLQLTSMATLGAIAFPKGVQSLLKEAHGNTRYIRIDLNDEFVWNWLLKLAASTLVTTLIAKAVEYCIDGQCYCNGSACEKNTPPESAYSSNSRELWHYDDVQKKFFIQNIQDSNIQFNNISIPFLDMDCNKLINIEGPYAAGLSWAVEESAQTQTPDTVKRCLIPNSEYSNGGYRFDLNPCKPTIYGTEAGHNVMNYIPKDKGGIVKVSAKGGDGKEYWYREYDFDLE